MKNSNPSLSLSWPYFGMIVSAVLLSALPAHSQRRPSIDLEVPDYPVDAAACAAFLKSGDGTVQEDPYKIPGLVPEKGMRITSFILPDSPIFRFYASMYWNVLFSPASFDPALRCFVTAELSNDGLIHYHGVPAGHYLVFTTTVVHVDYQISSPVVNIGMSPEGPVVVPGDNSTQTFAYDKIRVYMASVTMAATGVTAGPQVEIAKAGS